jgi:hypothetical protein
MQNDKVLLALLKGLIEKKMDWGDSAAWVNQDFIALSKRIQQETGGTLSHVTLKRLWGKIKYDALPQTYTLNVLAEFAGYPSWRDFAARQEESSTVKQHLTEPDVPRLPATKYKMRVVLIAVGACLMLTVLIVVAATKKNVDPRDYTFSSHTTVDAKIPNSVVFDYDASKSPEDSVIIQQSWDKRLRTTVSRNSHQHTLIYYYPGFFQPKLIVDGQVVKEHSLLIPSNGWISAVMRSPIPVYFPKSNVLAGGHLQLSSDQIKAAHIAMSPDAPSVSYCNVQDFGPIYSDDFDFETAVRNDFREGTSACQMTNIFLLCEGTAIGIPLCAKGCESAVNFFFTDFAVSGKQKDLSVFGTDFKDFVRIRVHCVSGRALIYVDDKLVYTVDKAIMHSKIIGIDYVFQGTGSVDYARLRNKKVSFDDEFNENLASNVGH